MTFKKQNKTKQTNVDIWKLYNSWPILKGMWEDNQRKSFCTE